MNQLIHNYVKEERALGKVYHFRRKSDQFGWAPVGTESYFHIMKELNDSRSLRFGELSIYDDRFCILINQPYVNLVIEKLKVETNNPQLRQTYGDLTYVHFLDEPKNFIPQLRTLVEKIKEIDNSIRVMEVLTNV